MFRSLLLFGVISSLMAAGQSAGSGSGGMTGGQSAQNQGAQNQGAQNQAGAGTGGLIINSGYVTTGPTGVINPPLLSPPNVALPGSGPATGAPPSMGVNDPRSGGTGSVVIPVVGSITVGDNPVLAPPPAPVAARGETYHGVLNTGLGTVIDASGNSTQASAAAQVTVADVARTYKARRGVDHPREIDNASLGQVLDKSARNNAALIPQTSSSVNEAQPASDVNQTQTTTAALDQRDLATVEAELARSRAAAANAASTPANANQPPAENTTIAQANQPAGPTTPQVQQSGSAGNSSQAASANAQAKQQLPATASSLPMLALMGLFAAVIGAIVLFRSRRAQ